MTLFDAGATPEPAAAPAAQSAAVPAARPEPPPQVKLVVAYDGTDFSGFAAQPNQPAVRTVGGALAAAIGKVLRHDVQLACAGRRPSKQYQTNSMRAMGALSPGRGPSLRMRV